MKNIKKIRVGRLATAKEILAFIKQSIAKTGYPPIAEEIALYFGDHRGRQYTNQWARNNLYYMRSIGLIEIEPYQTRGIKIL